MSNVPKLRFREFEDEWENERLGKITKLTDGMHFTPIYMDKGVPFWSVETISNNIPPKYISEETHKKAIKRCCPEKDDLLVTRIGTLGKVKLIDFDDKISIYVSLALIKSNENFDSRFMKFYIESPVYQKEFLSKSLLTASPQKINMEDMKFTKVNYPSLPEQEKIASFLSLYDKKIELQEKKVESLKKYKKGMMQKIFSQELRFKDENGENYPDWENKKIGDVLVEPIKEPVNEPWQIEYLTVKLHCLGIEPSGKKPNQTKNGRPYYKRFKNELLIGRQNFHNGGIGIVQDSCDGLISSNAISSYIPSNDNINIFFIKEYISRKDFYKRVENLIGGTGQKEISKKEFESIKIKLPSLPEQEKIASLLSTIDKKIELEEKLLEKLKEYKKGLLQQMFV